MIAKKLENKMRIIRIEKVVLNIGGVGEKLDKGVILLQKLTGKKPSKTVARKRIPTWGVRPGLELGAKVTLRGKDAEKIIERILPAINNTLKEKQMKNNTVSFGVHEYIEIPSMEYIREVGIMGFEIAIVFVRAGRRVSLKKVKSGKIRRQDIVSEEMAKFMEDKFQTKILRKVKN